MDKFTKAYIEAILWAETDNSDDSGGEPLDRNYSIDDIAPSALAKIEADCKKFQDDNSVDLDAEGKWSLPADCTVREYAGHDFWLTRQGHGCGFWDGDWPDEIGDRLTKSSESFGECYPYVGDDGVIYIS